MTCEIVHIRVDVLIFRLDVLDENLVGLIVPLLVFALIMVLLFLDELLAFGAQQLNFFLALGFCIKIFDPVFLPHGLGVEDLLAGKLHGRLEVFLLLVNESLRVILADDLPEAPALPVKGQLRLNLLQGRAEDLGQSSLLKCILVPQLSQIDDGFACFLVLAKVLRHLRDEV